MPQVAVVLGVDTRTLKSAIRAKASGAKSKSTNAVLTKVAELFSGKGTTPVTVKELCGVLGVALVKGQSGKNGIVIEPIQMQAKVAVATGTPEAEGSIDKAIKKIVQDSVAESDDATEPEPKPTPTPAQQKNDALIAKCKSDLKDLLEKARTSGATPWNKIKKVADTLKNLGTPPLGMFDGWCLANIDLDKVRAFVSFGDFQTHGNLSDVWLFMHLPTSNKLVDLLSASESDIAEGQLVALTLKQWAQHFIRAVAQKEADEEAVLLGVSLTEHGKGLKKPGPSKVAVPKKPSSL